MSGVVDKEKFYRLATRWKANRWRAAPGMIRVAMLNRKYRRWLVKDCLRSDERPMVNITEADKPITLYGFEVLERREIADEEVMFMDVTMDQYADLAGLKPPHLDLTTPGLL